MSNIRALTPGQFSVSIGTNEDWTDSWGYYDASNKPISGTGIALTMMMRATPDDPKAWIIAGSSPGLVLSLTPNGALAWDGDDGNLVTLAIPKATMSLIPPGVYVAEVQASADGITRTVATITVTVNRGVVR